MNKREFRALGTELRAVEQAEGRTGPCFAGYAAEFNVLSLDLGGFVERILPGAFSNSIVADDIRCLFNHSADYVLGRNTAKTMRLWEDDRGCFLKLRAPTRNGRGICTRACSVGTSTNAASASTSSNVR